MAPSAASLTSAVLCSPVGLSSPSERSSLLALNDPSTNLATRRRSKPPEQRRFGELPWHLSSRRENKVNHRHHWPTTHHPRGTAASRHYFSSAAVHTGEAVLSRATQDHPSPGRLGRVLCTAVVPFYYALQHRYDPGGHGRNIGTTKAEARKAHQMKTPSPLERRKSPWRSEHQGRETVSWDYFGHSGPGTCWENSYTFVISPCHQELKPVHGSLQNGSHPSEMPRRGKRGVAQVGCWFGPKTCFIAVGVSLSISRSKCRVKKANAAVQQGNNQ